MAFKPAQRRNAKLRLALSGPAGSGKTYTAIMIAKLLCPPGAMPAVMDSERGSAEKYARKPNTPEGPGNWDFDHCNLEEKTPQDYISTIGEAAAAGYGVLVSDSYTHSWLGALEIVDKMGGWVKGGKVVSPLVAKLVDAILAYPGHVIATLRSKTDNVIEKDDKGRTTIRKVGMATVAREGTDYEFDVMLDLSVDGVITVSKTRCSALAGGVYDRDDVPKIVAKIRAWLDEGAPVDPLDELMARIRAAADDAALSALGPEIKLLTPEEKKTVHPVYMKRKQFLAEGA